ncbi:MAG: hypothetical protein JWR80_7146 [Bradyrhizobium sp.]|nr:hypothetical protein [Bradyrhizobium sp.]
MANFTPSAIDGLRAGRLPDPQTPGLLLECLPSGKKIFRYTRRVPVSKRIHKETLGPWPAYRIIEAREWAQAINAKIDRGIDPVVAKAAETKAAMTVAEAHEIYMAAVRVGMHKNRQRLLKPRSIFDKECVWKRDFGPKLGSMPLAEVTADQLWDLVLEKGDPDGGNAPSRANRLAGEIKVFFRFCCLRKGSRAIGLPADPSVSLSGYYFDEKPRTRFLTEEEIGWYLVALASERRMHRRALLLLLLTGARKSEVIDARGYEYSDGCWTIPAERSKNSEPLLLPLSPWGRSVFAVNTDWIFPSDRKSDGPQSDGWYEILDRIQTKMEKSMGRPIEKFRPHDLRRTFRSNTKRLKIDRDVAEALLHHKKAGLDEIYDQYDLRDEKVEALAKWENYLIGLALAKGVAEALEVPAEALRALTTVPGCPSTLELQLA